MAGEDSRATADEGHLVEEQRIAHEGALARWAGHCAHHPWRVVFTWLGIVVVLIGLNVAFHGKLINDFKIPGSDTQKATDLITAKFGGEKGAALRVVLATSTGRRLDSATDASVVRRMIAAAKVSQHDLAENPKDLPAITSPLSDKSQLSDTGRVAFFDVQYDRTGFQLPRSGIVAVEDQLRAIGNPAGIQAEFTGEAESAPPTQGLSDFIGLFAAFIILLVLFRALVPTAIPLLFAIVAVLSAFLILFLAARLTHFNTVTEILVPMIGLGVGIDYTLLIVTRFRQLLHDGLTPQEAAAAAGATAGRAVLFAGVTVAISITGLALIGLDFITKLGIGSALGVLTAVLLANSLLPAVLALLGPKIDRGRLGLPPVDESREGQQRTPVAAWGRFVSRNAKIVLPTVIVVLVLLASPVLVARLGLADAGTAPKDQTTRKAYDLLTSGFGPGFTEPIPVVIDIQSDHAAPTKIESALKQVPGLKSVNKPIYNKKNANLASVAILNTYGRYAPQDPKTDDLVALLRHTVIPRTLAGSSAHAYVSGTNAAFTDIGHQIFSRVPVFLFYIIGITFLVLAMAFRSAVIAFKAALTTLMSALVGFGVLTFVVQKGHGLSLIGLDRTGPIESFVPPIAFAILFGLSMDYEVFLMSRIREEHVRGADTVTAVKNGISGVGRVIVAAALIMSSVFFSFLLSPDRVSKEFGLLLGVAILTDALLMRMTLVPALLTLLRDRTWWIPRWLDRALPDITIEPPGERPPTLARPRRDEPAHAPVD
ncbi:MAG TPA: MMPL family transporter [Gaiellaceae bacterium]|jgi:RND superfamily putative drug exporter|nr:MMPL family transporter [Gaiellaceae bacterium]